MTPATRPPTGDLEETPPSWFLESVERVFEVGDRVRIRLSAECNFAYDWSGIRHQPYVDGAIGVIREGPGHPCVPSHNPAHMYSVWFDEAPMAWIDGVRHSVIAQCFAALELEPVTTPHGAAVSQDS